MISFYFTCYYHNVCTVIIAFPLYFHYGSLIFWGNLFFVGWTHPSIKGLRVLSLLRRTGFKHRTLDESQLRLKYNHDYQKASDFEKAKKTTIRHIAILTIEHSENIMVAYLKNPRIRTYKFSC